MQTRLPSIIVGDPLIFLRDFFAIQAFGVDMQLSHALDSSRTYYKGERRWSDHGRKVADAHREKYLVQKRAASATWKMLFELADKGKLKQLEVFFATALEEARATASKEAAAASQMKSDAWQIGVILAEGDMIFPEFALKLLTHIRARREYKRMHQKKRTKK